MTLRPRKTPLTPSERAKLNIVPLQRRAVSLPPAPPSLEPEEAELWAQLTSEFVLDDAASLSVLAAGLAQRARARRLRALIDAQGESLSDERWGVRPNPLLPHERASVGLYLQALKQLRIDG